MSREAARLFEAVRLDLLQAPALAVEKQFEGELHQAILKPASAELPEHFCFRLLLGCWLSDP